MGSKVHKTDFQAVQVDWITDRLNQAEQKVMKNPVYDLPLLSAYIYLFRWSRWLFLSGVVGRFIFLPAENSGGRCL